MPKPITQPTTAQSLGALLKSARDIMRKDKGLNGDLDRLPMLTWIMLWPANKKPKLKSKVALCLSLDGAIFEIGIHDRTVG